MFYAVSKISLTQTSQIVLTISGSSFLVRSNVRLKNGFVTEIRDSKYHSSEREYANTNFTITNFNNCLMKSKDFQLRFVEHNCVFKNSRKNKLLAFGPLLAIASNSLLTFFAYSKTNRPVTWLLPIKFYSYLSKDMWKNAITFLPHHRAQKQTKNWFPIKHN